MDVTIVICTRDHASLLATTLGCVAELHVPDGISWELLVVDNGSQDATSEVLDRHARHLPLRVVREPRAGLAVARNTAVANAQGDYLIWTDDDTVIDPEWLAAYTESFRRHPTAAVFGGTILPRFDGTTPRWMSDNLAVLSGSLAYRDFGEKEQMLCLADGVIPYGPNFAIRRTEQCRFPFDPRLGKAPGQRRVCEETAMIAALLRSGATGWWVPRAKVWHRIPQQAQSLRYVLEYHMAIGEGREVENGVPDARRLFGAPRWLWRRAMTRCLSYCLHRLTSPTPVWLRHYTDFAVECGALRYWRAQSKTAMRI